jgi:low temperature requirement protein LtrA
MTALLRPLQLRYVAGANPARRVTWLELFFDLIFVAAVAQVAEPLRDDFSLAGIVRFSVLFVLIWWAWIGNSLFATRFDTDDGLQRLLTLLQMFALAAMAANAGDALESRSSAGFAAAYAVVRFVLVAQYARARQISSARGLATRHLAGHGLAAGLWLASAFVPAPARYAVWTTAMAIDLGTPWLAVRHAVVVPPDASHLPERFGLFTLILLGECVIAVMHGMQSQENWSLAAASAAFFGMAMAFALWWWYFDGAGGADDRHVRTHRDALAFQIWSYAHLPFYVGSAIAFTGVERIVHEGAAGALHGHDGRVISTALAVAMLALVVIGRSRGSSRRSPQVAQQLALAVLTIVVGASGWHVPAVLVVMALTTLCVVQLALLARTSEPWPPPHAEPLHPSMVPVADDSR